MGTNPEDAKKSISDSKTRVYGIVALCVLLLYILMAALGILKQIRQKPSKTSPPDLSRCTRLIVQYGSSLKDFSLPIGFDPNFFSVAEIEHLQSLDKIINDAKKSIKDFARQVSSGSYEFTTDNDPGPIPIGKPTHIVVGYRNDERIALVVMYGPNMIKTEDNNWFEYKKDLLVESLLLPEGIKPLVLRMVCGGHLWVLYDESLWPYKKKNAYPSPTKWCDIIIRDAGDSYFEKETRKRLKCPALGKGKCHYALNPNCKPNSPPNTVLLFETKAGWNQHGGPELFTFDNHDPKGGCVLLNGGTVKFIRTREELHQLLWK